MFLFHDRSRKKRCIREHKDCYPDTIIYYHTLNVVKIKGLVKINGKLSKSVFYCIYVHSVTGLFDHCSTFCSIKYL